MLVLVMVMVRAQSGIRDISWQKKKADFFRIEFNSILRFIWGKKKLYV